MEWTKRLEEEKQQHLEMDAIRGDGSDEEDDIDKMEAKLAEHEGNYVQEVFESSESEPEENDMKITDTPRVSNPLLDDEAEESDCENYVECDVNAENNKGPGNDNDEELGQNESDQETSDEDSSDDEGFETDAKPKKGRILKAFEDSDDETSANEDKKDLSKLATDDQDEDFNNSSAVNNANSSKLNCQGSTEFSFRLAFLSVIYL